MNLPVKSVVKNEQLLPTILQLLNRFTKDGLEIITDMPYDKKKPSRKAPSQKKSLPQGFTHPIQIENYDAIASREELYER